jgi:fibronectin type 3 domain-containing protein
MTPFGWKLLNTLCVVLALASCDTGGGGGSDNDNKTYAKEVWGEWLRMDTGDKWYISDNALKINGANAPLTATLHKQSDRVIEVTDGGRKYYLYASRTATASFTGTIVGDAGAGSARAIGGGLGGIRVSIENLVNKANELTTDTDTDGKFTADGVILGDAYKLTPQGGTSVTVIPTSDGDDIGVVTITSGVNFKTSLIPTQSTTDVTELYMNEAYEFEIEFENTGNEDCFAPTYTITAPSGVSIDGDLHKILTTIVPGNKKSVPIVVRCSTMTNDHEYKKINITIIDGEGKTWEDSVSLRFYKESMGFNIKAEKPVSGILISPDTKTYSFTNVTNGTVYTPRRVSGDYLVVFSGATIETETPYALGIGIEADGDFSKLSSSGVYEKNDTEDKAVPLNEQKIMAYLHKNDIDYYRVSYGNFNLLPTPTNVSVSAANAQVTVSWTRVTGARSYNVYRADSQTGEYSKVGESLSASYGDKITSVGTYYYKVSAVNTSGFESIYSTSVEVMVTGPSTPTDVFANAADAEVTVSWNTVTGASLYNVYRADSQNGTYSKVGVSVSSPYTDTVTATGTYYYKVSAAGAGGIESVRSAPTEVVVTGPSAPIDVSASAADTQVTVSWAAVTGASSYNVYRANSQNGTYSKVGVSASSPYIEIIASVGTYYYEVSAVSAGGFESAHSTPTMAAATIEVNVTSLYETLSWLAVNAVNSTHYTLLLGKDETISAQTLSYSGKDITVTLKGKGGERAVNLSGNGSLFTVMNGVTLVLDSGVTLRGHGSNTVPLITVNSGGNLVLKDGGEISGNTATAYSSYVYGGGVYVSGGAFTMSGGKISGNRAYSYSYSSYGDGVYISDGTFTMSGGEISNNTASSASFGGGVYVSNSTFTMSGGKISGNTASVGGGAYVYNNSTFTMSDGEISGNTVYNYGGGVEVYSNGTFTMSGGKISGNTVSSPYSSPNGGGVESGGTFTMSGGEISGNTVSSSAYAASVYGGGVYISGGTFTKQAGGVIYGSDTSSGWQNTATNGVGHAVYVAGGNKRRDTTAGAGVTLSSAASGSAGGWEDVSGVSNITYSSVSGGTWTLQDDGRRKSPWIDGGVVTKARVSFTSTAGASIIIQLDVSSELEYDRAFVSTLDNSSATYYSGYFEGSVISGVRSITVTIPISTAGSHFIDIGYSKDSSLDRNDDCVWFKVIQ